MEKHIILAFGRFQGITAGHQKVFELLDSIAKKYRGEAHVHMSQSNDHKKNPLKHDDKVRMAKKLMPHLAYMFESDRSIKTPFHMLAKYSDPDATVHMVAGGDRARDYQMKFDKYNGRDYHFKEIIVHNAGERTDGISGTAIRNFAVADNYDAFKKFAPSTARDVDVRELFGLIRDGLLVEGYLKTFDALLSEATKKESDKGNSADKKKIINVKNKVVWAPDFDDYQMATHDKAKEKGTINKSDGTEAAAASGTLSV